MIRGVFLWVLLALCSCGVVWGASDPESLNQRAKIGKPLNDDQKTAWHKATAINDNSSVVATLADDDVLALYRIDANMNVVWKNTFKATDDLAYASIGMIGNELAVCTVVDDDPRYTNLFWVDTATGKQSATKNVMYKLHDDANALIVLDFDGRKGALAMLSETIDIRLPSGDVGQKTVTSVVLEAGAKPIQVVVANPRDGTHRKDMVDRVTGDFLMFIVRDSLTKDADEKVGKYLVLNRVSKSGIATFSLPLVDTINRKKAEYVTIYPASRNDSSLVFVTYHADDDFDLRRIEEYAATPSGLVLVSSIIFDSKSMRRITGETNMEEIEFRSLQKFDEGTLVVLERLEIVIKPDNMSVPLWMMRPQWDPMTNTFRYDQRITRSEADRIGLNIKAEQIFFVFYNNDGTIKWVSKMGRNVGSQDDSQQSKTNNAEDTHIFVSMPENGAAHVLWRDFDDHMIATARLSLSDGSIKNAANLVEVDNESANYGLHPLGNNTYLLFNHSKSDGVVPMLIKL